MLIIDGVKYRLWTPRDEEKEFQPLVEKHSKHIFGADSLYFPKEKLLVSKSGRGVMPDAFAVIFSENPEMYVVEVELSSHDLDKHIVGQLNRFGRALRNPENRKKIADMLYREIRSDPMKNAFVKQVIGAKELYKFLSDLVSQHLKTVIIIENKDAGVVEACEGLKASPEILEFKTFVREDAENVQAHLFESLIELAETQKDSRMVRAAKKAWEKRKQMGKVPAEELLQIIENEKMKRIAIELRHAITEISDKVRERTAQSQLTFRTSKNFAVMYFQKRGFWLHVRIPRQEFRIPSLDVRPHKDPVWTHIRVHEQTNIALLLEAARQAYKRVEHSTPNT
jgi:hypothetical protein